MKTILKCWFILGVLVTGFCLLLYTDVQQDLRQSTNDPQIQMAEDAADKLAGGQQTSDVIPKEQVDIARSLASYIIVFDATGKPIASSAQLNGQMPTIPPGVFDSVKQSGEDRFTWQPQSGVRSAVVVTQFQGPHPGFVLAGRSLREVEKREDEIANIALFGWIGLLFILFAATAILFRKTSKKFEIANE